MPSNYTPKYQLNQWAEEDRVLRTDFNADNAKIEAALAGKDAALDSLKAAVNGKASQTSLDALAQTAAQHSSALAGKGNCQIYVTSYAANRQYGAENPISLTFPHRPMFVYVTNGGISATMIQGITRSVSHNTDGGTGQITVSWDGSSVSWYAKSAGAQLNEYGSYTVFALLDAEN